VPLDQWTPGWRADDGVHAHDGWWRCVTCGRGHYVEPPTAVEDRVPPRATVPRNG
jgi:hypothetical protein